MLRIVRVTNTLLRPSMKKTAPPRKPLAAGMAKVLKWLHYPLDVMLLCVRWYVAYWLSLRDLEEMMAERAIGVDHSMVHRWGIKRRSRPMLGFKDFDRARVILSGIEVMHMIEKDQMKCTDKTPLSAANQFYSLAS